MIKFLHLARPFAKSLLPVIAILLTAPMAAQQPVGTGATIDGDLVQPSGQAAAGADYTNAGADYASNAQAASAASRSVPAASSATGKNGTWHKDDLIGAAEGVFGKGAAGLADIIQDLLKKQGEPNAYIVGREGGGAMVVGLRYGSGTMHHKVEGQRPVYWTGPSVGFDAGANAASTFVLVYNLYDGADVFHRYGAGEGQAYLVGGFHVSYLRRKNVVLIPVRAGAGLRLGINAGYMKFSKKQNWFPF